jgi:hypothetical protein
MPDTRPFYASRQCGWRDASSGKRCAAHVCEIHHQYLPAVLDASKRQRVLGRAAHRARYNAAVPRWTIADTYGAGASAYRMPAAAHAVWTPLQAAILDAAQHMRRWRYYAEDAAPPVASANVALDGCPCRWCLSPADALSERAYWRHAARQRWQAPARLASFASESEDMQPSSELVTRQAPAFAAESAS